MQPFVTRLLPCFQRMSHVRRAHPQIKLLRGKKTELQSSLAQTDVLPIRGQRDLCRLLVSDVRVEGGDQHERNIEMLLDPFFVWLDPLGAALAEGPAGIRKEFG